MRIAVSGGGTAGHVSPVLATVDALRKPNASDQFIYIGQAGGIEAGLAKAAGLPFAGVCGGKFRRLPGAGFWRNLAQLGDLLLNLRDLVLIGIGALQSWWILGRFHPDVVFNKAGPAGLPVGLACRWLRIPMVIHEPDLVAGLNNRMLSRWASAIAVGFPTELYPNFPAAKLHYTGNPVQPALLAGTAAAATKQFHLDAKRPVVVIVGGSQGAMLINQAVAAVLPQLTARAQVVHVTGPGDYPQIQQAAAEQGTGADSGYHAVAFLPIEELGALYRAATVVVARAGASTIAELAALVKPVVMLPNHQAAAHQLANARALAAAGAAIVLTDEQPQPLLAAITSLLDDADRRRQLSRQIAHYYLADAPTRLAELLRQAAAPHARERR